MLHLMMITRGNIAPCVNQLPCPGVMAHLSRQPGVRHLFQDEPLIYLPHPSSDNDSLYTTVCIKVLVTTFSYKDFNRHYKGFGQPVAFLGNELRSSGIIHNIKMQLFSQNVRDIKVYQYIIQGIIPGSQELAYILYTV